MAVAETGQLPTTAAIAVLDKERWSGKLGQRDKWIIPPHCGLIAAAMIDRAHDLPLATPARLLGIARSTVYRQPDPVSTADLTIMRRIGEPHLDDPFAGSRILRSMLASEGIALGRTHVRTLLRRMGIEALYRRPRTSKPAPGHKIYPYLLRDWDAGSALACRRRGWQLERDAPWRRSLRTAYGSASVHPARARLLEQRNRGTIHL